MISISDDVRVISQELDGCHWWNRKCLYFRVYL